jgi:2-polyprenyl-6-methoxyphenol hydroxylase-like FAD-dependent oxidoreductase
MSNEFDNSDVIIIGGGLAGLTTDALLARSGKTVTLFEHSSREIGGRARTAEIDGPPAWKQLPTWFEVSEGDHIIPPDVQRNFAKRMNATTISLNSSHASLVTHPAEIAELILNAAKGNTK